MLTDPAEPRSLPGAAIVLAAGASTRLGQAKQLVEFEGQPLLRRAAIAALESGASPVYAVLGAHATQVAPVLRDLPVSLALHDGWQEGMGSSLRCGMQHLLKDAPATPSVLVLVCDQPLITAGHLRSFWRTHLAHGKVVAASYGDHVGVPAIFPASLFPELARMEGDRGARQLLQQLAPGRLEAIPLAEAHQDLDTPEDLRRLTRQD